MSHCLTIQDNTKSYTMDENIRFGRCMLMMGTAGLLVGGVGCNLNVLGSGLDGKREQ